MSNQYNKKYYGDLSEKTGFQRDIIEKVHRLTTILEYINSNPKLSEYLNLKGGTSINLTVFNLPRLSVDIDLDFCGDMSREEMLEKREEINNTLFKYFEAEGYELMPKSKTPHSLDSWILGYTNTAGNHDNIKIEINYSLRAHILPTDKRKVITDIFSYEKEVGYLNILEIFGSKIAALLGRTTARDLYDLYNIVKFSIVDDEDMSLLRKCVIFYRVLSSDSPKGLFDASVLDKLTSQKIKQDLIPVLKKKEDFSLEDAKGTAKDFLENLLVLTKEENEFIDKFYKGEYIPELLFEDEEMVKRIATHPMVIWKMSKYVES